MLINSFSSSVGIIPPTITGISSIDDIPVIVGGIIPTEDEKLLINNGVEAVYTPKNYQLKDIMSDIVGIVEKRVS